ncbi:MAG: geranylgeranyl reductase family protein [Nanoarchaeota archaeon]|nr:geranylgeranyl reductase family protein [Nanoarchaeota archaeon]
MDKKKSYDMIVIGAGPAGSEIAYRLARQKFNVLVLEKARFDREKPCGGGIQLKELLEFSRLPPEIVERKIRNVRIVSPQNNMLEAGIKNRSFFAATVKRSVYDSYLQKRAERAGADFLENKKVKKVIQRHGKVFVYSGNKMYTARLVIDASGASSGVAKMLGIDQHAPEVCATYHMWLKVKDIDKRFRDSIELYFMKDNPRGYAWIFPKKDIVSVGIGSVEKVNLVKMLNHFIRTHPVAKKKFRGFKIIKKGGGLIPLGLLPRLYSTSAVVIGDAGGFANIIHGGGIYQARKSAVIAAKHCIRFLRTENQKALAQYDNEARDFFNDYEIKWDKKIRNILWNEKTIELLIEKGKKDDRIKEALGIVLTSARSHKRAYEIMENKMLEMIYSELGNKAGMHHRAMNSHLRRIFRKTANIHKHANDVLLNDKAKRLRATLGMLAAEMFKGNPQRALEFSIIYEIFHTASLIHDDIIDESEMRRGRQTLHKRCGLAKAIIVGDLMLTKCFSLISRYSHHNSISKRQVLELLDTVGDSGENCCIGEEEDICMAEKKQYNNIEQYLNMIALKTGSLIEGCVKGGAIIAGASKKRIHTIGSFGRNLGVAFQIIDDSLDLLGGKSANKSVMNDLRQGKATPMLIHALKNSGFNDRKILRNATGNKNITPQMAEEVIVIYRKIGAIEYSQRLSKEYIKRARDDLMLLPKCKARQKFSEIVDVLEYWSLLAE